MIGDILKMMRSKSAKTAADMRKALAEAEAALPAAEAELGTATAERAGLLLVGTDREVLDCERRIEAARLTVDRLRAAAAELGRRADEAERRERDEALTRQIEEAERAAARAAAAIHDGYERLASQLGGLLDAAVEADRLVTAARYAAFAAGRDVSIKQVEERLSDGRFSFHSILASTSLRPVGGFAGYGVARQQAVLLGGSQELHQPACPPPRT